MEGILPLNEYGNIEVWEGLSQFVPEGASFIEGNNSLVKLAKTLGIQHAPAVTGFEQKGLHTVPIVGGVVVLKGMEQLLQDAAIFTNAAEEEKYYQKRNLKIAQKWERIVGSVLSRQRLRDTYGH